MTVEGVEVSDYTTSQEDVLLEAERWFLAYGAYQGMHGVPVLADHHITINAYGVGVYIYARDEAELAAQSAE